MSIYRNFALRPRSDVYANTPLRSTLAWVAGLPPDVQPTALVGHFARIAKLIAYSPSPTGTCCALMHLAPHARRLARATKRALLLATLCIGSTVAISAQAIGLDEIAQQSGLGEPLRLVIPLLTDPSDELAGEEFAGECYRVVSPVANDLPQVQWAKVALEHRGGRALLVVSTAYPINEPMMRVAVRAGCRVAMSREYTLFFDPVAIEAPVVAAGTAAPAEVLARAMAARPPRSRPVVQHPVVPRKHFGSVARTGPLIASKRPSET